MIITCLSSKAYLFSFPVNLWVMFLKPRITQDNRMKLRPILASAPESISTLICLDTVEIAKHTDVSGREGFSWIEVWLTSTLSFTGERCLLTNRQQENDQSYHNTGKVFS